MGVEFQFRMLVERRGKQATRFLIHAQSRIEFLPLRAVSFAVRLLSQSSSRCQRSESVIGW
ncbi:hypothetical protein [Verrucomicrobium spinosum]|uniref:hypothetical protein n=1 Tax=Verrucomicrobium spinosum TaxID=2736 RepID=UPI0009463EF0|nr:hypothetical protein [Verrucomicrobium spinosum]